MGFNSGFKGLNYTYLTAGKGRVASPALKWQFRLHCATRFGFRHSLQSKKRTPYV